MDISQIKRFLGLAPCMAAAFDAGHYMTGADTTLTPEDTR
jgi:hypothetical protein